MFLYKYPSVNITHLLRNYAKIESISSRKEETVQKGAFLDFYQFCQSSIDMDCIGGGRYWADCLLDLQVLR